MLTVQYTGLVVRYDKASYVIECSTYVANK